MRSVTYTSSAVGDPSDADLADLLVISRVNNRERSLTGLLLYRRGRFLQVLEGPDEFVEERMAVITVDDRHADVRTLVDEPISERRFPEWTMGFEVVSDAEMDRIPGFRSVVDDAAVDADAAAPDAGRMADWFRPRSAPDDDPVG